MNNRPLVSFCMPTNGVEEWVFAVLNSIYDQTTINLLDENLFEIVITDNGKNDGFKHRIKEYIADHPNIMYAETDALPFINEIEAYKRANGEMIKYVNHRTKFMDGSLEYFIQFARDHIEEKPIVYFTTGVLKRKQQYVEYDSFDQFVKNLSYWSSWSTGMTIWKEDLDKFLKIEPDYNVLFPHTHILFNERNRGKYIIDNTKVFDEIPQGKKPKGDYDLYYAFGVEYPWIILNLLRDKSITSQTFRSVIDDNLSFIAELYLQYNIRKQYCSYDLSGLDDMYDVFYSKCQVLRRVIMYSFKKLSNKLINIGE